MCSSCASHDMIRVMSDRRRRGVKYQIDHDERWVLLQQQNILPLGSSEGFRRFIINRKAIIVLIIVLMACHILASGHIFLEGNFYIKSWQFRIVSTSDYFKSRYIRYIWPDHVLWRIRHVNSTVSLSFNNDCYKHTH